MRRLTLAGATAVGIIVGGVLFNATPAYADWPVIDVTSILKETGILDVLTTIQSIENGVQTAVNTLLGPTGPIASALGPTTYGTVNDLLREGFTQEANYAKASVGAQENLINASNEANAAFQRNIRNAQVRDQHILSPQACIALDSGQSMTAASVQAAKVSAAIGQIMDARGQARPGTPAWEGQGKAMEAITQLHLARYCDENEQTAGLCTIASPTEINADQDSSSLFGEASYTDQNAVDAANDYSTELIQPVVPAAIRGDALASVAGQDQEARRRGYNAQMSLARGVLSDVIGSHAGSVQLTTAQQQQMQIEGMQPATAGSWFLATDLEVNRHLGGTDWQASLQYMPEKSVLVEIATEMALGNYIAWQHYQVAQKAATVDAAILADRAQQMLTPAQSMPAPQMASQ